VNHLRKHGYSCEVDFGFWDVFGYKDADEPEIAVLQVKNTVNKGQIARLAREKYPIKVVLADSEAVNVGHIDSIRVFLAHLGVGLYIRGVGWYVLPGSGSIHVVEDVLFKVSKRWYQDEDGNWRKDCTKCGRALGPESFYRQSNKSVRDPYRHICRSCFRK
jgi:hypothetical protein